MIKSISTFEQSHKDKSMNISTYDAVQIKEMQVKLDFMKTTTDEKIAHIQGQLNDLINDIKTLNGESTEYNIKLKNIKKSIEQLEHCVSDVAVIHNTIAVTKIAMDKLETIINKHIQTSERNMSYIQDTINNLPNQYQSKGKSYDWMDYIKVAPSLLTIVALLIVLLFSYGTHIIK